MHELGIIFLHHKTDEITLQNLESFKRHNPDVPIVTVSSGEALPGGHSMDEFHALKSLWRERVHNDWQNRSHDFLLYSWYSVRKVQCKRWFVVEWDTYCSMPVTEFCKHVWDFAVAGPSIRLLNREPEWYWFETIGSMPKELREHACGVVPFSCVLFSDAALAEIVKTVPWSTLGRTNTDLRLGTTATYLGLDPVANPMCGKNVTWQPHPENMPLPRNIWHPVKWKI